MRKIIIAVIIISGLLWCDGKYWIFFVDKGLCSSADSVAAIAESRTSLTQRSLLRRAKVLPEEKLVDYRDVHLCEEYIMHMESLGTKIVNRSRWFNAVSARADSKMLTQIEGLPFVSRIRPVAVSKGKMIPIPDETDYSFATAQLYAENVPPLHKIGMDGSGVLVGINDTGFNPEHIAFAYADISAQWDFVSGDSNVDYEASDTTMTNIPSHGSFCWSLVGGYLNDKFSGCAPGVSFLLARTENLASETPIEEDNWVAAMEWADSIGVDIISTSLGYYEWYDYFDMDGDTPIISAGADRAVYLGISVFVAAGNNGGMGYGSLTAPGDADSAITVGMCDNYGNVSGSSSRGPTFDGRIKPDILAPGVGSYGVNGMSDSLFRYGSGTSMATPMAAGAAALLLQLRPRTTPMQLRHILRMTASNPIAPNNDIGWGLLDARAAAAYPVNDTAILIIDKGWSIIAVPADTFIIAEELPVIPPVYAFSGSVYIEADTLVPGVGYFLLSPIDTMITLTGEPITELEMSLKCGWNLVAGLSRRTMMNEYLDILWNPCLFGYRTKSGYYATISIATASGVWLLSNEDRTIILTE